MYVCDSRFYDHLHCAAQFLVSLLQQQGVFLNRNNVISIAADVQQRDGCIGQWLQVVDWAECFFGQHFFVADVVDGLQFANFSIAPFSCASPHRPAADIADRSITEDAGDFCGIGGGPVVAVEATATGTDECGTRSEAVIAGQCLVDLIPVADRCRGSEQITAACVDDMKASSQQSDVRDRPVSEKFTVPDPWLAVSRLLRDDHGDGVTIEFKIGAGEAVPCAAIPGQFSSLSVGISGQCQQDEQQEYVRGQGAHGRVPVSG